MSVKAQLTGTVVSDKMEKTVVVAVERQVRHEVYGKSQRKTSKFVAHNENNEAKVGRHRGHCRIASAQPPQAVGGDPRGRERRRSYRRPP
jgi:ribosomal protein S17